MSRPADVPHVRPAGSSPQFLVTRGAGLGSPSPVIGLATFDCADIVAKHTTPAPNVESRTRDVFIDPPVYCGGFTLEAGRVPFRIHRCMRRPLPASPVYM